MLASKEELAFLWDMAKKNSEENSFLKISMLSAILLSVKSIIWMLN